MTVYEEKKLFEKTVLELGFEKVEIFGEHSYKDIGGVYGKTENWARVTYYRAKEKATND